MDVEVRSRALVSRQPGGPLSLEEVGLDALRPGEVRVRMMATGLCHTDLHAMAGKYAVEFPAVFGHEGAGVVEAVGVGVAGVSVGDRVVLAPDHCGQCVQCRSGRPAYCAEIPSLCFSGARPDGSTGFELAGEQVSSHFFGQSSLSQLSNVSARCVVPLPDDIAFEVAAPLGCAGQTGVGTVINELRASPGESVGVFGAGAVGLFAIMAAVAVGCEVVAVDRDPARLALARELGARHVHQAGAGSLAEGVRTAVPNGIDHAIDTTGVPEVIEQAFLSLAYCGTLALVGGSGRDAMVRLPVGPAVRRGWRVLSVIEGGAVSARLIPEMIEMWRAGALPIEKVMQSFDLVDAAAAVEGMRSGAVVKPVLRLGEAGSTQ